jgi:arsenite-transporting ATPase
MFLYHIHKVEFYFTNLYLFHLQASIILREKEMGLKNIIDEEVKLIMVGGKGGVGKTTCASAIALKIASGGRKVLVISSDPTPSLSDIFETPIGSTEVRITGEHELYGLEISSEAVLKRWKERFGREIYEVVSSFANVDYDFVDYIGTAPGIEEEYMLSFIMDLVGGGKYDAVVWDTAPAGHTLRLLKLPHLFLKHMEAATKFYMNMYGYLEKIKGAVKLKGSKRTLLEIIGSWEALAEEIVAFIRDGKLTKYVIVTIPEALGVKLTARVIGEFEENRLKVENIIINHVVENEDCEFHKLRKHMQQPYIKFISDAYKDINITTLYLSPNEVKGIERIEEVSDRLFAP